MIEDHVAVQVADLHQREHLAHAFAARPPGGRYRVGVVAAKRGARGRRQTVAGHDRHRAVMAGADRDAFASRMVPMSCGWMPSSVKEITAALSAAVPTSCRPGNARKPFGRRCQQALLVRGDALAAEHLDVVERRAQTDGAGDVGRAGLEFPRQLVVGAALDARPTGSCRRRPATAASREQRLAPVEHADAGRAVDLVTGKRIEIAIEALHIDTAGARPPVRHRAAPARRARAPARSISRTGSTVPSALET